MDPKKIIWNGQEYTVKFQHRYGNDGAPRLDWFNELGCPVGAITTNIERCLLRKNETLISGDVPQAHIIAELERISMVRDTGRVFESKYVAYRIVEVLVSQDDTSIDKDIFIVGVDTEEWRYMWQRLGDLWINRFLPDPKVALNHFEVWQYMSSSQTTEGVSHTFRHRNHPNSIGSNGRRNVDIPASPGFRRPEPVPQTTAHTSQ